MNKSIVISDVDKIYQNGIKALDAINIDIMEGEIFALLGPNGAGKTTLIKIICGLTTMTSGKILINNLDIIDDYRAARKQIGLVPQELDTDMFETVWDTVSFTRGLFGLRENKPLIKNILKNLSLWEKRNEEIKNLSGGMKRRVLIAKALAHEPKILFLDEPTAGVDVELRQDMWNLVRSYQNNNVTIILTTHFIDEAEELADRVGVIDNGRLIVVKEKNELMSSLGKKQLLFFLEEPLQFIPASLSDFRLNLKNSNRILEYTVTEENEGASVSRLVKTLDSNNINFRKMETVQSSLEDIFVKLVTKK